MDMPPEADAPPRKPKQPFLRRGEGTKRRIDAYKQRKPLAVVAEAQPGPSDQAQLDASPVQHKEGGTRQLDGSDKRWDFDGAFRSDGHGDGKDASMDTASHAPQQAEEDLELEEFRALECEIWGGSQQYGQMQQQPLQQQQPVHRPQQHFMQSRPLSQQSLFTTLSPEAAEAAASAAYDGFVSGEIEDHGVDLSHNSSSHMNEFQDDTEWVDTEFSFAAGLADELPHTAHIQQEQQQQTHLQHKEFAGNPSAERASDMDAGNEPSQSYVRAIFSARGGRGGNVAGGADSSQHKQQRTGKNSPGFGEPSGHQPEGLGGRQQQMVAVPVEVVQRWQQYEAAQPTLQQEKTDLRKMRQELEKAAARLEQERQAAEKQKATAQASLEAWRSEEARRLARERRVLEQQSKALLKLPSKKEKSALDALQQQLEQERSDARATAARHRLTVERLRCQIKELQDCNAELREEVRWHEAQQLNVTAFAAADARSCRKPPTNTAQTQTDACLVRELSPTAAASASAAAMAARLEAAAKQQQVSAAARQADSLYAALFGEDEDDAGFAAAEQAAAFAASAAGPTGDALAREAAGQHVGNHSRPFGKVLTAAAESARSSRQQQRHCASPGSQLGRRVGNNVTLKPGISSADSPAKQQQLRQQAHGQPQLGLMAHTDHQHATCNHGNQDCPGVCTQRPEAFDEDTFTFASTLSRGAAVQSSSNGSDFAQQWHQHGTGTREGSSSSSSGRLELCNIATMSSDEAPDQLHVTGDTQIQQQQHRQGPTTAKHVHANFSTLDAYKNAAGATSHTRAAAAGSAAAYNSSSSSIRGPAATSAGRQLLQELQHPDGKCEQLFSDGLRVLLFANGTSKTTYPDGGTCIRFVNGDVKRQTAEGRVDYYYAEVATWQSTHVSDVEVFYFPTGQVEGHHADGTLDIIFPDGSIKRVMPDGSEQDITAGLLSKAVQQPPPELDRL